MIDAQQDPVNAVALRGAFEDWLGEFDACAPCADVDRREFRWPPQRVSREYLIGPEAWSERAEFEWQGERFGVEVARTPVGVFGRATELWNEAMGEDLDEMLVRLCDGARPLLERQAQIGRTLGLDGRFVGSIAQLEPLDLLKLLYCEDRDVTIEARTAIETHRGFQAFGPALGSILSHERHPMRRSAQWAALDCFEDLPSYFPDDDDADSAIRTIRDLMWDAPDDIARVTYKAGVVLGGHVLTDFAAEQLLACFDAPSRYARRSAYHAAFHLVEWRPEFRNRVVRAYRMAGESEPLEVLREYCGAMERDVSTGATEHVADPLFEDER